MPSKEEKLIDFLVRKNKSLSSELTETKSQLAAAVKKLTLADLLVHEFEMALMSGGVKQETLSKLKDRAKTKAFY